MENKKWIILCIIGGILMIISSTVGSITFFETIFSLLEAVVGEDVANIISLVIQILGYIAIGGGISVIVGAIIVAMEHYRLGKFIIGIGAGMGLFGLIISFIIGIVQGSVVEDFEVMVSELTHGSYGFLGIILTIIARIQLKKD
ncbi:MAG: hypothetical protein ACFE8B_16510 [Candidatus Hermodarchaeota archaeon]